MSNATRQNVRTALVDLSSEAAAQLPIMPETDLELVQGGMTCQPTGQCGTYDDAAAVCRMDRDYACG